VPPPASSPLPCAGVLSPLSPSHLSIASSLALGELCPLSEHPKQGLSLLDAVLSFPRATDPTGRPSHHVLAFRGTRCSLVAVGQHHLVEVWSGHGREGALERVVHDVALVQGAGQVGARKACLPCGHVDVRGVGHVQCGVRALVCICACVLEHGLQV
jgi:hypothetical protein